MRVRGIGILLAVKPEILAGLVYRKVARGDSVHDENDDVGQFAHP